MILQSDHHIDQVLYAPGTFEIKAQTEFTGIAIRTQIDGTGPDDVKFVNSLQNRIVITRPAGVSPKGYAPRE